MRQAVTCGLLMFAIGIISGAAHAQMKQDADDDNIQALREEVANLRRQIEEQQQEYDRKLGALEAMIEKLQTPQHPPPPEVEPEEDLDALLGEMTAETPLPTETPGFAGSLGRAFQTFNPDISVIGDFVGHYSSNEGGEFDDEFLFREVELGFSGAVDPYARADVFLGIHRHGGDWELHVEEAYVTYLTLPCDLQARAGRFKSTFGKTNPQHLHALPWVEYPLIIENYFGEEGLSVDGVGLSWLVPNPWDRYIELTYEVFNNDSSLFAGTESDDFVHLLHFKDFNEISDTTTLETGVSFATAPNDRGHGKNRTMIEGVDLTLKWRPLQAGLYKAFAWYTEVFAAQADLIGGQEKTWGMYTGADYQFARRWVLGTRYDYSQMPFSSSMHEHGYSTYLTFLQSEYLYWRLGYMYTDRNFRREGERNEHEVFVQMNFGLGPHRAHEY
ncbi:MAG: hypothetical protein PVI86_15605 [Phycisphaerae bacterium]|jgi:hypothetical protein